ncbi:TIR domain-containing protein [Dyella sp. LX-66]|uniref:toll/interleukin-1 receptor domain-containing protein n=1 Tax=unclassified Dyella TaxID=2634549 RepID=UPI001BE0E47C|nr:MULTISPECIES: toll/interleukin-1 receptor domain-containing protein [unclassified Dyella]MBT2119561.1 TIR domain-containing protein [Dyella sp. LX-1]MBT2141723.1 TIR domain-containing protein [Dyella sp. LX-66]
MEHSFNYLIPLDYGNRKRDREVVKQLLARYDRDKLVGCVLFVNNNPYSLTSFLFLNFFSAQDDFETWLRTTTPWRRHFRFTFQELMGSLSRRGFNVATFSSPDDGFVDSVMSSEPNEFYFFPDRDISSGIFGEPSMMASFTVFLSHSSKDKAFVDAAFEALHKAGVRAWYDRYEIEPGDSITTKINQGLDAAHLGLLFISDSFLSKEMGWPMQEANYFFQQRIRESAKKFVVVNLGLPIERLPPLLRDYRYIDGYAPDGYQQIVEAVTRVKDSS